MLRDDRYLVAEGTRTVLNTLSDLFLFFVHSDSSLQSRHGVYRVLVHC